jgi:hypothetical protein
MAISSILLNKSSHKDSNFALVKVKLICKGPLAPVVIKGILISTDKDEDNAIAIKELNTK